MKKYSFCWFLLRMSELTFKSLALSVCTATFNTTNPTFFFFTLYSCVIMIQTVNAFA